MPKTTDKPRLELAATRIDPDLKRAIEAEAARDERTPAWIYNKLIRLGWEHYQKAKGKGKAA